MTPYFTFAGFSGSGKTTLTIKVIEILSSRGYKIAALKHDGHKFQMDKEGKDTYRLKNAGAKAIAISSAEKFAMISDSDKRLSFLELTEYLPDGLDIIIGEGFKEEEIPKIVVHRKDNGKEPAGLKDKYVIAAATDEPNALPHVDTIFDINDAIGVANFVEDTFLKNTFKYN